MSQDAPTPRRPDNPTPDVTSGPALPSVDPRDWEEALGGPAHAAWLLRDPEVLAAIRQGRPRVLYRLFEKRRKVAPSIADRDALTAVLHDRRLFLDPTSSAPALSTLNGIGARIHGSQERDPEDGTYITTQFFTLLFLPLWPIAQYLVAKAEGRGWFFLGRVPLSTFHRTWRRVVLAGLAVATVALGASIWQKRTHNDVHFLNGLPLPVTVTFGDETLELQPGDRETRAIRVGAYHLAARGPDDRVFEELDVRVPRGTDLVVYNVLGAAPLVLETVGYAEDPAKAHAISSALSLAADSWVVRDDVDYVFRVAPEEVRLPKKSSVTTQQRVYVYPGGWSATLWHLVSEDREAQAAALARKVARLLPGDLAVLNQAIGHSRIAGETGKMPALLEALLASRPDDLHLHRSYQSVMQDLGRIDEIEGAYRAAYEADPHDARAGYLHARIRPHREALPLYAALLAEHPDDPWLLRGLAWVHFQQGRFVDALPLHLRLLDLFPEEAGIFVDAAAQDLVAVGRVSEALERVAGVLDAAPGRQARGLDPLAGGRTWQLVGLHARLARLASDPGKDLEDEARWLSQLDGDELGPGQLLALAAHARWKSEIPGGPASDPPPEILTFCTLTRLSQSDVAQAARMALETDDSTLLQLDDEVQLAIACELDRSGQRAKAEVLLSGLTPDVAVAATLDDVRALPAVDGLSEELEPMFRATMLVAASRRVEDEARRNALLAEARRLDVLKVVVPE